MYSIYTRNSLTEGLDTVEHYFGEAPTFFVNQTNIDWEFSPRKAIVDLRTMKYIAVEDLRTSLVKNDILAACQ